MFALLLSTSIFGLSQEKPQIVWNEKIHNLNQVSSKNWVKENLNEIRTMTRSEWLNLDENTKRACYVAFTQQQRLEFWKEKFDKTLELGWSLEETEHIKTMRRFVSEHPEYFDYSREKTDKEIEIFEIFVFEWKKKAKQQFKWTKNTIGGLIATGNNLLDKDGTIQIIKARTMTKSEGETNSKCSCSTDSDWCNASEDKLYWKCDSKDECTSAEGGCGTLWSYPCNGTCKNTNV